MSNTGMRQGELLGLKWSNLNWTTGYLQVRWQLQRIDREGVHFCKPKPGWVQDGMRTT